MFLFIGNCEKLMTFLGSDRLIIIELETILHFTRYDILYCHVRVLVYLYCLVAVLSGDILV